MTKHKKTFNPRIGFSMFGLAASLLCATPAFAGVVHFDDQQPIAYMSGDSIYESGYRLLFVEGPFTADLGLISGTGTVINSADSSSCDLIACPAGAIGNYLAILNDGAFRLTSMDLGDFSLAGFNFAFMAPVPVPAASYGQLVLSGLLDDGSTLTTSLDFPTLNDGSGHFLFSAADLTPDFRDLVFSSLTFSACVFYVVDGLVSCNNSVDFPAENQAQFAIDDIDLRAVTMPVPEPGSIALAGLGLAALGISRRRRTALAASV
jgi:hypothetical protein